MTNLAKRTREHYSAHGVNAHFVVEDHESGSKHHTGHTYRLAIRRGREDDGEAVQIQVDVEKHHPTRTIQTSGYISLDQKTWDALVEFVKTNNTVTR